MTDKIEMYIFITVLYNTVIKTIRAACPAYAGWAALHKTLRLDISNYGEPLLLPVLYAKLGNCETLTIWLIMYYKYK